MQQAEGPKHRQVKHALDEEQDAAPRVAALGGEGEGEAGAWAGGDGVHVGPLARACLPGGAARLGSGSDTRMKSTRGTGSTQLATRRQIDMAAVRVAGGRGGTSGDERRRAAVGCRALPGS